MSSQIGILPQRQLERAIWTRKNYDQNTERLKELLKKQGQLLEETGNFLQESGKRKIEEASKEKIEAKGEKAKAARLKREATEEKSQAAQNRAQAEKEKTRILHSLMARAIKQMIGPSEIAEQVIETTLNEFEDQGRNDVYVPVREKQCLRLTPSAAKLIEVILKQYPCTALNLVEFQDQIIAESIIILLRDKPISKLIFSTSAQGILAVKLAQKISKQTRPLEITFA